MLGRLRMAGYLVLSPLATDTCFVTMERPAGVGRDCFLLCIQMTLRTRVTGVVVVGVGAGAS